MVKRAGMVIGLGGLIVIGGFGVTHAAAYRCPTPAALNEVWSCGYTVYSRWGTNDSMPRARALHPGNRVTIKCWSYGQYEIGPERAWSNVWDSLSTGDAIADAFVYTGQDTGIGGPANECRGRVGGDGTIGSVMNLITQTFGRDTPAAAAVARCESGLDPRATNPTWVGNSRAAGVFQILYPSTWATTSYRSQSPYDARSNILAAHEIFVRDGYRWYEWVCRP